MWAREDENTHCPACNSSAPFLFWGGGCYRCRAGEFDWSVTGDLCLTGLSGPSDKYVLACVLKWFWCTNKAFFWSGGGKSRGVGVMTPWRCCGTRRWTDCFCGKRQKDASTKSRPAFVLTLPIIFAPLHNMFSDDPRRKERIAWEKRTVMSVLGREARGGWIGCWIASCVVISRLSPPGWGKKSRIKTVSVLKMWPPHHHFFCLLGTRKEFTDLSSARHYPNTPSPSSYSSYFAHTKHTLSSTSLLPPAILRIPSCNFEWPPPKSRHIITQ